MDALQAAVLRAKFPHLESWTAARQRNAANYRRLFTQAGLALDSGEVQGTRKVCLPKEAGFGRHIYHLFMIRVDQRDELIQFLKARQISSEIYYPVPLHLQECFLELGYQPCDLPKSEQAARQSLALPIYPELSETQQERVVQAVADFLKGC